MPETLAEFKDSFSYGSRTDLAFKFLKLLPEDEAGEFFRSLLEKLGETIDDGDATRLIEHAYEWQVRGYTPAAGAARTWVYDEGPFAPMAVPAAEARVALLTSSGHFADGDDPEPFGVTAMTQEEAIERITEFTRSAPVLSEIPRNAPDADVRVRHGGYDIRGALADAEVALPLGTMRRLEHEGRIGEVAPRALSFVGATSQRRVLKESAPQWVARLQKDQVDAVVLVPA
jgi:hypothetical protein